MVDNAQGQSGQSTGQKVVGTINDATELIGTLVPTIGAIGGIVRLIATAVRPTDAQKAQAFDAAIAEYDAAKGALDTAVAGFDAAKAEAERKKSASAPSGGNAVPAMGVKPAGQKPSDG